MATAGRTSTSSAGVELGPRKRPTQQRARELVDTVLDTTAALLDEVGVDALTTNLIAERAGIRVSSIYRYYPNKHAIMVAVWERLTERWLAMLDTLAARAGADTPVGELVDAVVESAARIDRTEQGLVPLLRAMRATPELHAVEARTNELIARRIAELLAARGAALPKRRLGAVARVLTESTAAVLDLSLSCSARDEKLVIDELKTMLKNYLGGYFSD